MLLLILFFFNLLNDYNNFLIFQKLKIFIILNKYYLIKYSQFIFWKNSVFFLFVLYGTSIKTSILGFLHIILIILGYNFFCENYYDFIFMKSLDITDSLYANLEPSFSSINSITTNEINNNIIQKNSSFYYSILIIAFTFIIINSK
jgi:hypothetical protein